jgi:hypothetical protein
MRSATRQAPIDQHSCVLLAAHELADPRFPPQALFAGSTGQAQAARGVRFLQAPPFVASTLSRKKPERLMALRMVMTVRWLV